MSMTSDALPEDAAKSAEPRPATTANGGKRRKAAKARVARQKASQSNRKPSGRNFKLSSEALKELRAEKGSGLLVPYRDSSTYHACIRALEKLGANQWHSLDKLAAAVIAEMGSKKSKQFKSKKQRNEKTGKGWKQRIIQNARVLARVDYGAKLRQVGYEVRTNSERGAGLFKLSRK